MTNKTDEIIETEGQDDTVVVDETVEDEVTEAGEDVEDEETTE